MDEPRGYLIRPRDGQWSQRPFGRAREAYRGSNGQVSVAEIQVEGIVPPHYHTGGETEIYIVKTGQAQVVVGNKIYQVGEGDIVTTDPELVHYVIPKVWLALWVVNASAFDPDKMILVNDHDQARRFDPSLYKRLAEDWEKKLRL